MHVSTSEILNTSLQAGQSLHGFPVRKYNYYYYNAFITCHISGLKTGVDLGGIPLSRAPQIFRRNIRFSGTIIWPDYQFLPRFYLGVVPLLKSRKSFIKCTEPINTTTKAARMELWRERLEPLDASVHLNISPDEHFPAGAENPWTTWKALNRLRIQVGRSRVNMLK